VLEGEEAVRKKAEMENMFSRRGKKRKMVHFNFLGEIKKQTMAYYHDRRVGLKYPRGVNSFTFLVVVQNDRKQSLWACDVTHMNTAIEYLCCTIFLLPPIPDIPISIVHYPKSCV
jgi:hypothetical protein